MGFASSLTGIITSSWPAISSEIGPLGKKNNLVISLVPGNFSPFTIKTTSLCKVLGKKSDV